MTARNPLYYDSGNLVEMTAGELLEWQREAIQQYAANPSVVITVGSGNIGTTCLLYTSPSPRDRQKSRMPSSA